MTSKVGFTIACFDRFGVAVVTGGVAIDAHGGEYLDEQLLGGVCSGGHSSFCRVCRIRFRPFAMYLARAVIAAASLPLDIGMPVSETGSSDKRVDRSWV